ncbi:MAG: alpha/beta hydrolase [Anaerolineales bacterium]|nr:alpha/beta hydrolase [Anaerolineales bacterium]
MINRILFYLKLLRVYLIAKRFCRKHEQLSLDVAYQSGLDVRLDVYSPDDGAYYPVLIFVHGGGWSKYNKGLFAPAAMKLLPEKMVVVIPDHTKYPHANYEQMSNEIAGVISWTLENVEQYGGDPNRVVVCGHSSGGHLVGLALMDQHYLNAYGHTSGEVKGVIYASSGYDLNAQYKYELDKSNNKGTDLMETMIGIAGNKENFSVASPVTYVRKDLPPALIIHGDADKTIPVSLAVEFHEALQEAGAPSELVIYPGRGHSEILLAALTENQPRIVADISNFVHTARRQELTE